MQTLSRRTTLKGLGVSIGVPFLEAMMPMSALASSASRAKRSPIRSLFVATEGGIWTGEDGFFPYKGGMDVERAKVWGKKGILPGGYEAATGKDWPVTSTLEPVAHLRDDFHLLSGLHHANDWIPNTVVNGHGQDLGTLLTAADISSTPGVALKNRVSFDQILARQLGRRTRVPSLALTVGRTSYNTKEATGLGYMGFLSYDVDGYALPTEGDPRQLFDRLFTGGSEEDQAARDARYRQRQSVLDSVADDMKRLENKVSHQDRSKLDEYFTTIRELEQRLERSRAWEDVPIELPVHGKRPEEFPGGGGWGGDGSQRVEAMRLMIDTLVLALQTDVTRIATFRLGGYYGKFSFLGFPEDPHGNYAHNNGDPKKVAGARAIDRLHMEQVAYLLDKMKSVQEPDGTLLDNSMVMFGAGLTNGPNRHVRGDKVSHNAHGQQNIPVMLAGHAGGALKGGSHISYDHGTPLSNLFTTMSSILEVEDERFADSTGPLNGLVG